MRLNPDCIRDLLIAIEDKSTFTSCFTYSVAANISTLNEYSHEEVLYHANQANMSGFIIGFQPYDAGNYFTVSDLTPKGHEFLANIRSDTNWNKVKEISRKVGSSSLNALSQIASNVITNIISFQCGLNH